MKETAPLCTRSRKNGLRNSGAQEKAAKVMIRIIKRPMETCARLDEARKCDNERVKVRQIRIKLGLLYGLMFCPSK